MSSLCIDLAQSAQDSYAPNQQGVFRSSCSSQVLLVIPLFVDLDQPKMVIPLFVDLDQPMRMKSEETLLVTDVSHLLTPVVTLIAVSLGVSSELVFWSGVQTFLH